MDLKSVAYCKIHPAIGIARVGGSKEFLIGPEVPGAERPAPGPNGFKDRNGQLLRQAARFRIYAYDAKDAVLGELTPGGDVEITWSVHLANTKAAWYDFDMAMDIPEFDGSQGTPPLSSKRRNADVKNRSQLAIDGGSRDIKGKKTKGVLFDSGKFFGKSVDLGELQTDADGRLIVRPAFGKSASKDGKPASTFANNPL
ncbi:MAG TPA: LodA/GoxA family CTQ-dependent oxidase, partial [Thermoanaerobaculia bacterium]|nr:LodA/GoxA family CTQ-dependent oxidase [Thermoanaerobaculia bacterium]